jgi:sugar lactone lactonase YvrE
MPRRACYCQKNLKNAVKKYTPFLVALLLAASITWPISASAGQYDGKIKFEHIGLEDGLPNTTVSWILQDGKGFMWFATGDGLVRYDGYEMKVFKQGKDDALSDSYTTTIYEDRDGILWIGTYGGGLNRYDPATDLFA